MSSNVKVWYPPPETWHDIHVEMTVVNGEVVYQK